MAGFTKFNAIDPIVQEAKAEVIYDKYWLQTLIIRAPSPKEDARMSAVFKLYNSDLGEFAPNANEKQVNIDINGLFAEAEVDSRIAQAMELIFQLLGARLEAKLVADKAALNPSPVEEPVVEPVVEPTPEPPVNP